MRVVDDRIEVDVEKKPDRKVGVSSKDQKIVIVGSGAAAVSAAEKLVEGGYSVKMITADSFEPYDRTLVSKRFAHVPYTDIVNHVDFIPDYSLVNIDEKKKTITIKNVQPKHSNHQKFATNYSCGPKKNWHLVDVEYDKLIIATGLKTKRIAPGGVSIYSALDAKELTSGLTVDKNIGIIGGSFLAVETASGLVQKPQFKPKSVTMFYDTNTPFGHIYGDEIGAFVAGELEALGVKLQSRKRLDHSDRNEEIDLFINAAGAVPETDYLLNSRLVERNDRKFIVTDSNFQTGNTDIYAVGDVSVANGINNQHWAYAQESGIIAAKHIMGEPANMDHVRLHL